MGYSDCREARHTMAAGVTPFLRVLSYPHMRWAALGCLTTFGLTGAAVFALFYVHFAVTLLLLVVMIVVGWLIARKVESEARHGR